MKPRPFTSPCCQIDACTSPGKKSRLARAGFGTRPTSWLNPPTKTHLISLEGFEHPTFKPMSTSSSIPLPRPLEVIAMMKTAGIPEALHIPAYEAMEPYAVLSWEKFRDTLQAAGLTAAQRMAVREAHRRAHTHSWGSGGCHY